MAQKLIACFTSCVMKLSRVIAGASCYYLAMHEKLRSNYCGYHPRKEEKL